MLMNAVSALLTATLLTLSACSPGPMPVAQSPHDPSNPNAVEGADPSIATAATASNPSTPAEGHHDHPHHHHGSSADAPAAGDTVYTCPMHPEVTSREPGSCSKCGMHLVPKK